jgi:hypothetical protein
MGMSVHVSRRAIHSADGDAPPDPPRFLLPPSSDGGGGGDDGKRSEPLIRPPVPPPNNASSAPALRPVPLDAAAAAAAAAPPMVQVEGGADDGKRTKGPSPRLLVACIGGPASGGRTKAEAVPCVLWLGWYEYTLMNRNPMTGSWWVVVGVGGMVGYHDHPIVIIYPIDRPMQPTNHRMTTTQKKTHQERRARQEQRGRGRG